VPAPDDKTTTGDTPVARLETAVRERIGAARFQMWFRTRTTFAATRGGVTVHVPDDAFRDWLEDRFGDAVREAAAQVLGGSPAVRFEVSPERFGEDGPVAVKGPEPLATKAPLPKPRATLFGDELPPPPKPSRGRKAKAVDAEPKPASEPEPVRPPPRNARRWRALSDFVVGPCNRLAHASVQSILEGGDDAPNPLVIHGPVGTGKTHLLESLFAGLRAGRGDKPVYVTAEEFTTRFVQASRFEKHETFRRQFRDTAALLLDDLHFLASKPGTQREFLQTLDALVADGRQVVVTMDCHPRLSDDLLPELTDRLLGGGVWGLLPPDDDTRLRVLRAKATGTPAIPDAVLKLVAKGLRGNVRELEGAVNTLRHYARVTGKPVDAALAREALGDLLRHSVRGVTVANVDAAVVAVLGLPGGALQSKARSWAVTHPRAIATYLSRKHTAATYGEIAKHFGVKTHSTAVAAEKRVNGWLAAGTEVAVGDRRWPVRELLEKVERELMK
jgi:chromosomal replication initiator protein